MPLIPYPDQIPKPLRKLGRKIIPAATKTAGVHFLQWAAQAQSLLTPAYRKNAQNLKSLGNKHQGEVCVILGNGPSLAGVDPDLLRNIPTFGLNRGYLLWKKWDFNPTYFVAVNDLVVEQFHGDIAALPCEKFLPWRHRDLFGIAQNCLFVPQSWRPAFRNHPVRGLWSGGTVTFTAMQLAYYMGFKRVVLIGVDHHFDYEGRHNAEVVSPGPDLNHFDSDYFGKGVSWNLPDLPLSEKSYSLARQAFEADGRQIINATDGGALEIFKRQSLEQALDRDRN